MDSYEQDGGFYLKTVQSVVGSTATISWVILGSHRACNLSRPGFIQRCEAPKPIRLLFVTTTVVSLLLNLRPYFAAKLGNAVRFGNDSRYRNVIHVREDDTYFFVGGTFVDDTLRTCDAICRSKCYKPELVQNATNLGGSTISFILRKYLMTSTSDL